MSLMISVSGIRGIIGQSLTLEAVGDFTAALGTYLKGRPVIVGRDSRPSGKALLDAAVESLTRCGCAVTDLGIVSTPGTALMVRRHRAAGGLVITASHNPEQWNGLKFLTSEGMAMPFEDASRIWAIADAASFQYAPADERARLTEDRSTHDTHIAAVLDTVDVQTIAAQKFKVVLDSINGAGCVSGKRMLEQLGCDVVHVNGEPTGKFAHTPEPLAENLGGLCEVVQREKADIGFAQDPDADRLAIVDEHGTYIGEEYTLALAAKSMFANQPGAAATNLSTSRMIDDIAEQSAPPCVVHRTAVGEANVVEGMRLHNCVIGGEGNGGVIDPRVVPVRDSLVAMALLLQLLTDDRRPLSAVVSDIPRYSMIKQKIECSPEAIERVLQAVKLQYADDRLSDIDGLRIDWPEGWVHVRGSNTEPIIRIIAEAADKPTAEAFITRIRQIADPILK